DIASLNSDILNDICTLSVSKTVEQAVRWQNKKLKVPKISINVAQIQSTSEKFVNEFMLTLNSHHLNPKQFELEFSEDIWKNDQETLDKIFSLLEKNSIDVCIDDFGSGYTSFVYIRKYKIDRIKIANDFVAQSVINKKDMQVVAAIINIAKSMKLKVTAKGVESHEIKELLK
ncbi:EAL domain-containing protein, partial [Providencia vermicola]